MSLHETRPAQTEAVTNVRYIVWVTLVAAMGGLLFGYDWVVIGGAKKFYELYFDLDTPFLIGWAMNSAVVGCILGALVSGALSDRFGRKRLLIVSAALFALSAVGTGLANGFASFMLCRWIGGVGMGLASALSPVYIAEISPAHMRGRTVTFNQLAINVGIMTAQLANWYIGSIVGDLPPDATDNQLLSSWVGEWGWRWMFWAETIPAALFLVFMFFVPQSPRWLVKYARDDKAHAVLKRVGGRAYADFEVADIKSTLEHEIGTVRYRDLLEPGVFRILLVGVFLAVFQQWCGINVVFQYAEEIFDAAGFDARGMLTNIVWQGLVFLIFTAVAIAAVDRFGRRILMLGGSLALALTYTALGWAYHTDSSGVHVLALVLTAIAMYSLSLAPITWVLLSEIFPNRIRGAAMSVAVLALWVGNGSMTLSFPYLSASLNIARTFWLYAVVCFVGFWMIHRFVPETKGRSLEDIERAFVDRTGGR